MPHVEQELLTLTKHLGSSPVVSGVRVSRLLCNVLLIIVCTFGHCIICPSLIYGFWFPFDVFNLFLGTIHHCIRTFKLIPCSESASNRNILSGRVDPRECDRLTLLFEIRQLQWKQAIPHLHCKTKTAYQCRIQDLTLNSTRWYTLHL